MPNLARILERYNPERIYRISISLCVGIVAVLGSYTAVGFSPSFVVTPVSRFLTRNMPDVVIQYAIMLFGDIGQQLNLVFAILLTVLLFSGVLFSTYRVHKRVRHPYFNLPISGIAILSTSYLLTFDLLSAIGSVLPVLGLLLIVRVLTYIDTNRLSEVERNDQVTDSRRSFIVASVGTALYATLGVGGSFVNNEPTVSRDESVSEFLTQAEDKSFDVTGLEPLVSDEFYQVDINNIDPRVDASNWNLTVTGEVESEVQVDYEELVNRESESRFETLRCVGDSLNGKKMDTAFWTGVPVMPLLEEANVDSGCDCIMVRAEDGYYQEFPIDALEDALLVYTMNGRPLPRGHGAPVRLLVPGHWGEINVKWITGIEALDRELQGFWEKRGWNGTGPAGTVAKLYAVNTLQNGNKELGGHAYAGTRGISSVEVSIDGGESWEEAELTEKLEPSIDAWRQWRYEYEPPSGSHTVVVRAIEDDGTVQPQEEAEAYPNGASGWISREVS